MGSVVLGQLLWMYIMQSMKIKSVFTQVLHKYSQKLTPIRTPLYPETPILCKRRFNLLIVMKFWIFNVIWIIFIEMQLSGQYCQIKFLIRNVFFKQAFILPPTSHFYGGHIWGCSSTLFSLLAAETRSFSQFNMKIFECNFDYLI